MSFEVRAGDYGRFMGRYSALLAGPFAGFAGVGVGRAALAAGFGVGRAADSGAGQRVLDVGCGTGELTAVLVARLGPASVAAVEPSSAFVESARSRLPGVEIRQAPAEDLPFPGDAFDVTLAQLVVHFMTDPVAGLRSMARVTRPGGVVAACVWDHAGERGPLTVFWRAARSLDPSVRGEAGLAGAREGHLAELFGAAGLRDVTSTILTVTSRYGNFEEWWEPYTLGVGPAGDHVRGLPPARRDELRDRCAALLPRHGPIAITATAWAAKGRR
ncbi:class I SAM-dependent methyltransferase [Actinoplanes sp. NPDC023714]|uniref:class I SAM-dependent methyltransferase n=1 Tax=Actinoplanes sp. NPDC023714 TaxID=3154322 RepID=UPI0033DB5166